MRLVVDAIVKVAFLAYRSNRWTSVFIESRIHMTFSNCRLLLGMMTVNALLSMFISNSATAVLMCPIIDGVLKQLQCEPDEETPRSVDEAMSNGSIEMDDMRRINEDDEVDGKRFAIALLITLCQAKQTGL